ncbi:uncharacterized protein LOC124285580 [Haliotis rubra]|uniref:uncharacterized protein LOC124285580 n=1 Tax=Haliotis rubra TaxID=36100 RepID=UPI001EE5ED93|nr:uncharacterized protein LOC124285580 [Haliotis rubra]
MPKNVNSVISTVRRRPSVDMSTSQIACLLKKGYTAAKIAHHFTCSAGTVFGYVMNLIRGQQRASHITGRSVHNQRQERLCRDVHKQVTETFYKELYAFEDDGILDVTNRQHIYALHFVYVPEINRRLTSFRLGWNCHRTRTEGNRSPEQILIDGIITVPKLPYFSSSLYQF